MTLYDGFLEMHQGKYIYIAHDVHRGNAMCFTEIKAKDTE